MRNTALVQAKVPADVKSTSEKIFNDFGLDISTAIRMFLIKVNQTRSIPFTIGYEDNTSNAMAKEFSDYLLSVKNDIDNDKNVLHFASNKEGFDYLERLVK